METKRTIKTNPSTTFIQMEQRPHWFYLVIGWTYMDSVTENLECWKLLYTFRDHKPLLSNKELAINTYCSKWEQLRILGITWHHSFQFCFVVNFLMSLNKPNKIGFGFAVWVGFFSLLILSQEQTGVKFCFLLSACIWACFLSFSGAKQHNLPLSSMKANQRMRVQFVKAITIISSARINIL